MSKFTSKLCLAIISMVFLNPVVALANIEIRTPSQEEALYFQYLEDIKSPNRVAPGLVLSSKRKCTKQHDSCLSNTEVAIQALDAVSSEPTRTDKMKNEIYRLKLGVANLAEQLQLYAMLTNNFATQDLSWEAELLSRTQKAVAAQNLSSKTIHVLLTHRNVYFGQNWDSIYSELEKYNLEIPAPVASQQALIDLVSADLELDKYKSGLYLNRPRVFMFCRSERTYPCLMIMKDSNNQFHKLNDGKTIWSQPSLGYSRHRKDYDETNGNTPTGVLRIDGVMPVNDQQLVFGKYRRLILNFVAQTEAEADHQLLLPPSSHFETWWRQAVISRDIGRGLFRIHGTGIRSSKNANFYPLVPTSGCVAKRENKYDGETFLDQRLFLDELMKASNLEPIFENEEKIRALLYVVNIDGKKKAVELSDLFAIGILKR
ncbi:MAG: hypothetical protein KDD38_03510 [Bdellovibrionales bacterium]|nr:hypothetical protein [Bdellovibrionales bacterium]